MLLQSPPPTRYDLRFSIAGIPVRVHPLFWLLALLLGSSSGGILSLLIWVLVVFVSVMVHELGHAFAMRRYGQSSQIVLHMTGGATIPDQYAWGGGYASIALTPNQEIIISLAGPFSGFFLAGLTMASVAIMGGSVGMGTLFGFIPLPAMVALPFGGSLLNSFVLNLLWVNIFWGIFNLLPVYPLDGGNVPRPPWSGCRRCRRCRPRSAWCGPPRRRPRGAPRPRWRSRGAGRFLLIKKYLYGSAVCHACLSELSISAGTLQQVLKFKPQISRHSKHAMINSRS